jgi:hypothetical protein
MGQELDMSEDYNKAIRLTISEKRVKPNQMIHPTGRIIYRTI